MKGAATPARITTTIKKSPSSLLMISSQSIFHPKKCVQQNEKWSGGTEIHLQKSVKVRRRRRRRPL